MLGTSKSADASPAAVSRGPKIPKLVRKIKSKSEAQTPVDDSKTAAAHSSAPPLKRAKTPPLPMDAATANESRHDDYDEPEDDATAGPGQLHSSRSGLSSRAHSAGVTPIKKQPKFKGPEDEEDEDDGGADDDDEEKESSEDEVARYSSNRKTRSGGQSAAGSSSPETARSRSVLPPVVLKSKTRSNSNSEAASRHGSSNVSAAATPPSLSTTATPSKLAHSVHVPSPLKHSVLKNTATPSKFAATPSKLGDGTPSKVRFAAKTEEKEAEPVASESEGDEAEEEEPTKRETRSASKPATPNSKPATTPSGILATPTTTMTAKPGATSPRTPTSGLRFTPNKFRSTGRPTVDLIQSKGLSESFSDKVKEKARSLYDRYQSRRSQGKQHAFPAFGFPEVGCIDLACEWTGEPNEHLSTLLSHAQLGTARNPQAQKTLFMGFRAELIRYLDVPPSARKPRGAFARQDSASEDETGAEVLSSSDLSALLNRIGLLEWKGEIESLLTAYSKGLRGSAREKETWVRGPAVVAGAIRAVAEARSKKMTAASIMKALPTSVKVVAKTVENQANAIASDPLCTKILDKITADTERDARKRRGGTKEDTRTSMPKPLVDPIQERRKELLAGSSKDTAESQDSSEKVARFSKRKSETLVEESPSKKEVEAKDDDESPRKKKRTGRTVFDKMKKEKKWVTGINPMIPQIPLLDHSNPRSKLCRFYEAQKKLKVLLEKWEGVWKGQRGEEEESDDEEEEMEEMEEEESEMEAMEVDA